MSRLEQPEPANQSVEDILSQMRSVRRELHHDADGVVDNARDLADWKHYVRHYPWACLGVAVAVGYVLIPPKVNVMRPTSDQLEKLARRQHLVVEPSGSGTSTATWKGKALTLASNLALRAALAYIGQQFGKRVGEEAAEAAQNPAPTGHQAATFEDSFHEPANF